MTYEQLIAKAEEIKAVIAALKRELDPQDEGQEMDINRIEIAVVWLDWNIQRVIGKQLERAQG